MNLADPDLELIDPTPNIHNLFITFDKVFFWTKLASRAVVRWSKRMYSCAGVCSYEGRGGLCDIALSEPLLKLRPRKNLVETLLHEMIHAYLFVTGNDRDRDGHGPNFQSHMFRINKAAGIEISIYHDFHDEVKLYQTHVWRCNGTCQTQRPFFGIVRRPMNRAPGPSDFWWNDHKRRCSGTFIKIKEPEKKVTKKAGPKKSVGDITKYINNNNTNMTNLNTVPNVKKTSPINKKISSDKVITLFDGKGHTVSGKEKPVSGNNVQDTVRNAWLKKQTIDTKAIEDNVTRKVKEMWANRDITGNTKRTATKKPSSTPITSPAVKIKKINDYFSNPLRDENQKTAINPVQKVTDQSVKLDLVDCPVCASKVKSREINTHIDECLSKSEIERLQKTEGVIQPSTSKSINIINPHRLTPDIIDLTNLPPIETRTAVTTTKMIVPDNKYIKDFYDDCKLPKPEFKSNKITVEVMKDLVNDVNNTFESSKNVQKCPCCELNVYKSMDEHLDECLAFFDNNATIPEEGASTSYSSITIDDDEDDGLDETLTMNATGTKTPCPVCLTMVEQDDMSDHLDFCLTS